MYSHLPFLWVVGGGLVWFVGQGIVLGSLLTTYEAKYRLYGSLQLHLRILTTFCNETLI